MNYSHALPIVSLVHPEGHDQEERSFFPWPPTSSCSRTVVSLREGKPANVSHGLQLHGLEVLVQISMSEKTGFLFSTQCLCVGQGLCPRHDRLRIVGPQLPPRSMLLVWSFHARGTKTRTTKDYQLSPSAVHGDHLEKWIMVPTTALVQWLWDCIQREMQVILRLESSTVLPEGTGFVWNNMEKFMPEVFIKNTGHLSGEKLGGRALVALGH